MNRERLVGLAGLLATLPGNRLRMTTWATGDLEPDCGTVGCALGWATTIFPELTLEDHDPHMLVSYAGRYGYEAACLFFGLTPEETHQIFDPFYYWADEIPTTTITPAMVASRIEALLES